MRRATNGRNINLRKIVIRKRFYYQIRYIIYNATVLGKPSILYTEELNRNKFIYKPFENISLG